MDEGKPLDYSDFSIKKNSGDDKINTSEEKGDKKYRFALHQSALRTVQGDVMNIVKFQGIDG